MSSIGNNYTPFYVTDADLEPGLKNRATALSYMSNRNRIINGGMEIDQRNAGSSVSLSSNSVYTLDRWAVGCAGNLSAQRTGATASRAITLTGEAGGATAVNLVQRVESVNVADLVGKVVTLSFVASSPTLTSLPWAVTYATIADDFSASSTIQSGTLSISSTPTRYSVQITLPAGAANGVTVAPILGLSLASGVSVSISNVQLEEGSVPTPFERRHISIEELLCKRYFTRGRSVVTTNANTYFPTYFKTTMRVSPSFTAQSYDSGSGATFVSNQDFAYQQNAHSTNTGFTYSANAEL